MGRRTDLKWNEWNPGLGTDDRILSEVLATMPASDPKEVPDIIKKYENPGSPFALPGAIGLDRHDCIHVLLGRGLHVEDEAFVIGVTMGASSNIADWAVEKFVFISTTEYPKNWRFLDEHIYSFRLGLGYAQEHLAHKNLHNIPLEKEPWQSMKIGEIRKSIGISKPELRAYFNQAKLLNPGSEANIRLDTSVHRNDEAT